jgi:hypothetical protein
MTKGSSEQNNKRVTEKKKKDTQILSQNKHNRRRRKGTYIENVQPGGPSAAWSTYDIFGRGYDTQLIPV